MWGRYEIKGEEHDPGFLHVAGLVMRNDVMQNLESYGCEILGYERDGVYREEIKADDLSGSFSWQRIDDIPYPKIDPK
jgi:hypothetical protein